MKCGVEWVAGISVKSVGDLAKLLQPLDACEREALVAVIGRAVERGACRQPCGTVTWWSVTCEEVWSVKREV